MHSRINASGYFIELVLVQNETTRVIFTASQGVVSKVMEAGVTHRHHQRHHEQRKPSEAPLDPLYFVERDATASAPSPPPPVSAHAHAV